MGMYMKFLFKYDSEKNENLSRLSLAVVIKKSTVLFSFEIQCMKKYV